MKLGEQIDQGRPFGPGYFSIHLLYDSAQAEGPGPWVSVKGVLRLSVDVEGLTTGNLILRGSNKIAPSEEDLGHQLGDAVTDDGLVAFVGTMAWIRAVPDGAQTVRTTALLYAVS